MKKKVLSSGLMVIGGGLLIFLGVGGFLALVMIAGGPNPPPPEPFTGHILLWLVCIVVGSAFAIVGIIRGVLAMRRPPGPH
jgi:membrane associated rhomboid family serine protease